MIAYGSLLVMALLPIFIGAYRSVASHKDSKDKSVTLVTSVFGFILNIFKFILEGILGFFSL